MNKNIEYDEKYLINEINYFNRIKNNYLNNNDINTVLPNGEIRDML